MSLKHFYEDSSYVVMTINLLPQKDFPFGNNIHFVYQIQSRQLLFLHSSLYWIISDGEDDPVRALISKIAPEDLTFMQQIFTNVLTGRFNGKTTFKMRGPGGQRWLHATPLPAEYKRQQVIMGTLVDITDEVLNMQSIERFTNKKNSILHMLGHDLRGPLNVAKSVIKVVDREINDPAILKKTGYIATVLHQSIDMINDLVKRELLETTGSELVRKRVDIVSKLTEYLEECRRSEALAEISFDLRSSADSVFINLDDAKFMQVVNNLISNSLKFTPPGGEITVTLVEEPTEVLFTFSDTGIGIPEKLLPEIFEKFTPARRPGLRGEPTIGLGLSIVKTIINWHEGNIHCESKEGNGTTFLIRLPKDLPL